MSVATAAVSAKFGVSRTVPSEPPHYIGAPLSHPPTAAYLHIPFCRRRCFYCDFPITVVGDRRRGRDSGTIREYLQALIGEIQQQPVLGPALTTVFFGGGTPSLLEGDQIRELLEALAARFGLASNAEISIEMDPATFDQTQARDYLRAGITRISLGSQAFQDRLLEACGRTHRVVDIHAAVADLRAAGCTNLSLDLISGLPGQTLADWEESLTAAIALAPEHISAYDLVLEPGTVFGKRYEPGEGPLPTDDLTAQMYRTASTRLRAAGFEHYEISNYARPGFQCRHNRIYWENRPFYGFGMGAASYLQGLRFSRPRTRAHYYQWLAAGCPLPEASETALDRAQETLMLGLRLAEGLDLHRLGPFAAPLALVLVPYEAAGQVVRNGDRLRLSDPEGFLISNRILADSFAAMEEAVQP